MNSRRTLNALLPTLVMLIALISSSCTKQTEDHRHHLLSVLPDDVSVVAFNPTSIFESAGASVSSDAIALPKQLAWMSSANEIIATYAELITSAKGIDRNCTVIGGNTDTYFWLMAVNDTSGFQSWADKQGWTISQSEGYTVCMKSDDNNSPAVVIDNDIAWFIPSSGDASQAAAYVTSFKSGDTRQAIASWKVEHLMDNDINIIVDLKSYSELMSALFAQSGVEMPAYYAPDCRYSTAEIDFDGPTLRVHGETFDEQGNRAPMLSNSSYEPLKPATLDLVKDCQIVAAFAVPDQMKKAFADFSSSQINSFGTAYAGTISSVINTIKSLALGISMDESSSVMNLKPTDITFTAAISYDKAAAGPIATDLIALSQGSGAEAVVAAAIKACQENTTFSFAPVAQFPDFKINFTGRDDAAIVTTVSDINSLTTADSEKCNDLIAYMTIELKKSHPLLTLANCPFGVKMRFTSTNESTDGYITLTDTDSPILESLISFIGRL